jgi:hypothetical protein
MKERPLKKGVNRKTEKKPRPLVLHRETIQILDAPTLLELAQGGNVNVDGITTTVNGCG